MTEAELQKAIIEAAHVLGWKVAHFRPAQTKHGWRTPVSADGAGFPDLVLVRDRVVFAEVKSATGKLGPAQEQWKAYLEWAKAEWHLWTPTDWEHGVIEKTLR